MIKTWVVGDIHGHFEKFHLLEQKMDLKPQDRVLCVGDLINRGPRSAEVLDYFMKSKHCDALMGNHDWAFVLSQIAKTGTIHPEFENLGQNPRCSQWLEWIRQREWMKKIDENTWVIHAGLWPQWSLEEHLHHSLALKDFFSQACVDDLRVLDSCLGRMNTPTYHNDMEYFGFLINVFTKTRFLEKRGTSWALNFTEKTHPLRAAHLSPWYTVYPSEGKRVLFGHWSALQGLREGSFIGLDTGCSWGGPLSAYCLETQGFLSV